MNPRSFPGPGRCGECATLESDQFGERFPAFRGHPRKKRAGRATPDGNFPKNPKNRPQHQTHHHQHQKQRQEQEPGRWCWSRTRHGGSTLNTFRLVRFLLAHILV